MSLFRAIPINVHAALEVAAAPLLIVAPFALGFGYLAGALSIALGVLLIGLATSVYGESTRGNVPLSAHAGLDYTLAGATIAAGVMAGIAGRLRRNSLFGRVRLRPHGADRLNAVQSSTRSLRPATSHRQHTHISPPCSTPENGPLRRAVSFARVCRDFAPSESGPRKLREAAGARCASQTLTLHPRRLRWRPRERPTGRRPSAPGPRRGSRGTRARRCRTSLDVGVAHELLDRLGVRARVDQQRGEGVPRLMHRQQIELHGRPALLRVVVEGRGHERLGRGPAEDQLLALSAHPHQMLVQVVAQHRQQRDRPPARPRLRLDRPLLLIPEGQH